MKPMFLAVALCATLATTAQQITVRNLVTREPIAGAVVRSTSGAFACITDAKGQCALTTLDPTDSLEFIHLSFGSSVRSVASVVNDANVVWLVPRVLPLSEFVISANRFQERETDVAEHIDVIKAKDIAYLDQPTTGDLLQNSGAVFVQKSQMGGGSPVIRGFEASRVLLVVDGVRLNNAIYRAGHLQDIMTVDQNTLERMEVISGPASVVYGSDALGGVVHMMTRSAPLLDSAGLQVHGGGLVRYASANGERTGHLDLSISGRRVSSFTSITGSKFGDLRQGAMRDGKYPNFGQLPFYVEQQGGMDVIVANNNPNVQLGTAYDQVDLLEKLRVRSGARTVHQLNLQYSTSSNVPRYDRLSTYSTNALQELVPDQAEWYYGPQERMLLAYTLELEKHSWADHARITPSYQRITQSRHNRSWGSSQLGSRVENVSVQGLNAEFERRIGRHEIRYGLEAYNNDVSSKGERRNINTGEVSYLSSRYPNGGSTMTSAAVFLTHTYEAGKRWVFSEGLRFNYVGLTATFADDYDFQFLNGTIRQRNSAFNWRAAVVYRPNENWRFTALANTGFRAPNVDDLSKVFDSTPGTVVVPNPSLRPEHTLNAELGMERTFNGRHKIAFNAFHTWYTDALVVRPYQQNGQDSILYDDVMSKVTSLTNAGRAFITGGSTSLRVALGSRITSTSSITYTYGRVVTDSADVPLDHIPPLFGRSGIEFLIKRFRGEAYVIFNGWKRLRDYSDSGEDNLVSATPDGMPAWFTLNVRGSFAINSKLSLQLALENIADKNYRTFSSGVSAPGRNVQISLRASF